MEPEETATIVRLVKSVFPQQPVDPTTYETWHLVIGHLEFTTAQAAVIAIAHSQKFCAASDIIAEADRAGHRHAHPSERTVREAIEASTLRELEAPTGPPNAEYQRAKAELLARQAARDAAAVGDGPQHPPVAAAARRLAYAVACPWCAARPGDRCTNSILGTPKLMPHAARVEAGRKAA